MLGSKKGRHHGPGVGMEQQHCCRTITLYSTVRYYFIVGVCITIAINLLLVLWIDPDSPAAVNGGGRHDDGTNNLTTAITRLLVLHPNRKNNGRRTFFLEAHKLLPQQQLDKQSQLIQMNPLDFQTTNTIQQQNRSTNGGKERVLNILRQAGIPEAKIMSKLHQLPTWEQIIQLYGSKPIIVGRESSCQQFQKYTLTRKEQRIIGPAGMFSTGTNLLMQLLKQNCYIPERWQFYGINATTEQRGMRWQVPWGKHTPAHYMGNHSTTAAAALIDKKDVLPVVTIRNPWRWMQSMCKNPYAAQWEHYDQCPNLKNITEDDVWNEVTIKYGAGTDTYKSLQHLWNDWYNEYYNMLSTSTNRIDTDNRQNESNHPLLIVRMEDLVFHAEETITAVCECAGGKIYSNRPFQLIEKSAKASSPQGHDTSIGLMEAWIKYSRPLQPGAGFSSSDYQASIDSVGRNLLNLFQYQLPPTPI